MKRGSKANLKLFPNVAGLIIPLKLTAVYPCGELSDDYPNTEWTLKSVSNARLMIDGDEVDIKVGTVYMRTEALQ